MNRFRNVHNVGGAQLAQSRIRLADARDDYYGVVDLRFFDLVSGHFASPFAPEGRPTGFLTKCLIS